MRLLYVSHPEVVIDPAVPVPDWPLSDKGRQRTTDMAARGWPEGDWRVVSSTERKAVETAEILAAGRAIEQVAETAEIDRTSTGYLPFAEHEAQADALFGHPEISAGGWERAVDAQARMIAVLDDLTEQARDIVMVGHGGVGTLLWCHIAGRAIARSEDQAGGGHVWSARYVDGAWAPVHGWCRFEAL